MSLDPRSLNLRSYEDLVGQLLAEIADLLLGDRQDWSALERLQQALTAKTGLEALREVSDTLTSGEVMKAWDDALRAKYETKIRDLMSPPEMPLPEYVSMFSTSAKYYGPHDRGFKP